MRRMGVRLLGDGFDEVADREVDGATYCPWLPQCFPVFLRLPGPFWFRREAKKASPELFGGEGGFKRWRPDHSSDYENSIMGGRC